MKRIIDKIPPFNFYSVLLKLVGIGFIISSILYLIFNGLNRFVPGLVISIGIIFIGLGEIINLLQKILDKKRK